MALMDFVAEPVASRPADVAGFVAQLSFTQIPGDVLMHARRTLLDLIGVAAGGSGTRNARIAQDFAAMHSAAGEHGARMLFDGRRVSLPGAAAAGAAAIDAYDCHATHHCTGGHPAASLLPALLAVTDEVAPSTGAEFLTRFVLGYEVAVRAGTVLQVGGAEACSGAWSALGTAALFARALNLGRTRTRHALGAAEYFAPRGQIKRNMDYPSMVMDGSMAGAHAGVTAALLAQAGFTGAPALSVEEEELELWSSLGHDWMIREQSLNPLPVSRWAQPAVEAALKVFRSVKDRVIESVVVETFEDAARLTVNEPETVEAAHLSVPFAVAEVLVHGRAESGLDEQSLADDRVMAMAAKIKMSCSPTLEKLHPQRRCARLVVVTKGGELIETPISEARGGIDSPLSDTEMVEKFLSLAEPVLGRGRALSIAGQVAGIERAQSMAPLIELLVQPPKEPEQ